MNSGPLLLKSLKNMISSEEWQARVDLAACYRLIAHYGMSDMIANHITLRVPGEEDAFLINPYGMMYEEMTASCFLKIIDMRPITTPYNAFQIGLDKCSSKPINIVIMMLMGTNSICA